MLGAFSATKKAFSRVWSCENRYGAVGKENVLKEEET